MIKDPDGIPLIQMMVDIATGPGSGWVARDGQSWVDRGLWQVTSDSGEQVAINPNAAAEPRIDLVVLEVLDQILGSGTNDWTIRVVEGVPSSAPERPAEPLACSSFLTDRTASRLEPLPAVLWQKVAFEEHPNSSSRAL